ncbi:MAG: PorV/PorQ family protein [Gemmatimonadales bacterium]|nr:PorV/PorQ family protein [Gemmatimonadales bacterium]
MKRLAILTTILMAMPSLVFAAGGFAKVGTFGGQFLKIGVSARATGMGSAYTGVVDDASAVFWNVGGLVNVLGNEVSLNHVTWAADTNLSSLVVAFNPRSIPGTFALSARSYWMDPMLERTARNPEGTGHTFDAGMSSYGLSYARFFTDKFSTGFTLNYLHMALAEAVVNSGSFDFGIMYRIGIRDLKLGMTIQNLGGKYKYDDRESKLPVIFKVGSSFTVFQTERQHMLAAVEFQHPSDNLERSNVGLEYNLNDFFFLRGGYHINYDSDGVAGGFGVSVPTGETTDIVADYSAVDMDALGIAHRITVRVIF